MKTNKQTTATTAKPECPRLNTMAILEREELGEIHD